MVRAIIWCCCSTDESRQDVELQIKPCEDYCKQQGWTYDVVSDYASRYKSIPEKLQRVLDLITAGTYQAIVVYSMDRFSRQKPAITEKMLNHIVECKCRFITILERLDSDNPMIWHCFKGIWIYFANQYSVNLSKKITDGMKKADETIKEKGFYISRKTGKKVTCIGRPPGSKDKKQRTKKGYYKRVYPLKLNFTSNTE
jgi:DNA invertase Pin-like site-specific DNA recombinase